MMSNTQPRLFSEDGPVDTYDMVAMAISNFGERRRLKKMYRRQLRDRVVAKIEGDPFGFALQLGLGLAVSAVAWRFGTKIGYKLFIGKPGPDMSVHADTPVMVPMLSIKDLEVINNALKEATNARA